MNTEILEQLQTTFKQQNDQLENVKQALCQLSDDKVISLPTAWLEELDAAVDTVRSLPSSAATATIPLQFSALRA